MRITEHDLQGLTAWTLIRAAHRAERELTQLFAEHGLTPVQFGVLANLAANESLTQAQLAERVLVRPQTISGVIDTMVRRGLVGRDGERRRGRANPIALTAQGLDVLEAIWPEVQVANSPAGLGLDEQALEKLNQTLHLLLDRPPPDSSNA